MITRIIRLAWTKLRLACKKLNKTLQTVDHAAASILMIGVFFLFLGLISLSKKIIISHENLLGATAILGLSYSTSDLFKNLNRFYQLASNQENKSENICTILESVFKIIAIPALIGILILKDNIPLFNYTNTLSIAAIGLVIINFALDEILNKLQIKK